MFVLFQGRCIARLTPHACVASIDLVAIPLYFLVESLPLHYSPIDNENCKR
jgi:hypothetical protein